MKNWIRVKFLHWKFWWNGELRHQSIDEILRNAEPVRPLPVRILLILGAFWLNHWKWIITTTIAVILIALKLK